MQLELIPKFILSSSSSVPGIGAACAVGVVESVATSTSSSFRISSAGSPDASVDVVDVDLGVVPAGAGLLLLFTVVDFDDEELLPGDKTMPVD